MHQINVIRNYLKIYPFDVKDSVRLGGQRKVRNFPGNLTDRAKFVNRTRTGQDTKLSLYEIIQKTYLFALFENTL